MQRGRNLLAWAAFVVRRQVGEVRTHGIAALTQTIAALLGLPLAPFLVIGARVLRPVVLVRFCKLVSVRIGHLAANTEVYLCEKDAGLHGPRTVDLFYHSQSVCNFQLKKMWDRTLPVFSLVTFAGLLAEALARRYPEWRRHVFPFVQAGRDRDLFGFFDKTPPHLAFTSAECARGEQALRRLGMSEGTEFICFAARDKAYLERLVLTRHSWSYHDYRDADIQTYLPAVEHLTDCGYYALRMGATVEKALATSNRRIIDYATHGRSDFMDIYLPSRCRFFIGDTSGLFLVAKIFRRPMVQVNSVPFYQVPCWGGRDLFIHKKIWHDGEHRLLTFREILCSEIGDFCYTDQYQQRGLRLIANSPEEIRAVVAEMEHRLNGAWETTTEDEKLQRRFWTLMSAVRPHQVLPSRVGAAFLRENRALLD